MVKTKRFYFILSFLIFFTALPQLVQAAPDGGTKRVRVKENSRSLFPRHFYMVYFFRDARESENKFTLRLASYGEVTGCASMTDPKVEKKQVSNAIRIELRDTRLRLNDREARYATHDCEINRNESFTDIELDRDELIKDGIKKLALESEKYGEFLESEIDVNEQRLILTTHSDYGTSLITFWFFPKNSVVLYTPSAKHGVDFQDMIRDFGIAQGLVPMEDAIEKFELPYNADHYVFFTDPEGGIVDQIEAVDDYVEIGAVTPTKTVYGPDGPVEEPYELSVYATLPTQNK